MRYRTKPLWTPDSRVEMAAWMQANGYLESATLSDEPPAASEDENPPPASSSSPPQEEPQ